MFSKSKNQWWRLENSLTFDFKGLDLTDLRIKAKENKRIPVFGARNEMEIGESGAFWAKLKGQCIKKIIEYH